jgi:hypothetical protein
MSKSPESPRHDVYFSRIVPSRRKFSSQFLQTCKPEFPYFLEAITASFLVAREGGSRAAVKEVGLRNLSDHERHASTLHIRGKSPARRGAQTCPKLMGGAAVMVVLQLRPATFNRLFTFL